MISRTLTIPNRLGLHARAAAKLVHTAGRFAADIRVARNGQEVEAKSILGLLLLAAPQGSELTVICDGEDEEAAFEALSALIRDRFGEDE